MLCHLNRLQDPDHYDFALHKTWKIILTFTEPFAKLALIPFETCAQESTVADTIGDMRWRQRLPSRSRYLPSWGSGRGQVCAANERVPGARGNAPLVWPIAGAGLGSKSVMSILPFFPFCRSTEVIRSRSDT